MSVTAYLSDLRRVSMRAQRHTALADASYLLLNQLLAAAMLVCLAPAMAFVAWRIWRHDGAPIVFGHYRVGLNGKLFRCLKFRTMCVDADTRLVVLLSTDAAAREEWERDRKLTNDPRITPFGHLLRRTSIDELPQLVNVLRGEMTLVGPRPITYEELHRYGGNRWHYLAVRPGITGLWQVSGRSDLSYEQRIALDRRYVERRSLAGDVSILLRTLSVVLSRGGAR